VSTINKPLLTPEIFHLDIKNHMTAILLVGWGGLLFSIKNLECNSDISSSSSSPHPVRECCHFICLVSHSHPRSLELQFQTCGSAHDNDWSQRQ
jgi:hypothetical protein